MKNLNASSDQVYCHEYINECSHKEENCSEWHQFVEVRDGMADSCSSEAVIANLRSEGAWFCNLKKCSQTNSCSQKA